MSTPGTCTLFATLHLIHALFHCYGTEEYGRIWDLKRKVHQFALCTLWFFTVSQRTTALPTFTPQSAKFTIDLDQICEKKQWELSDMFWQKLSVLSAQQKLAFSSSHATLKINTGKDPVSSHHHHLFQGTKTLVNISGTQAYSWEPVSIIHVHSLKCLW